MGSSKSYRGPAGFEDRNTPGGTTKASKGPAARYEGTVMSGGGSLRSGMKGSARNKSKSGKGKLSKSPYGES